MTKTENTTSYYFVKSLSTSDESVQYFALHFNFLISLFDFIKLICRPILTFHLVHPPHPPVPVGRKGLRKHKTKS